MLWVSRDAVCVTRRARAVQEIANDILTEQTPRRLFQVRGKVYELLTNVVPPELIMRQLASELMKKMDDEVKHEVGASPLYLAC